MRPIPPFQISGHAPEEGHKPTGFLHHNQIFDVINTFFNYDIKNLIMIALGFFWPTLVGHVKNVTVFAVTTNQGCQFERIFNQIQVFKKFARRA